MTLFNSLTFSVNCPALKDCAYYCYCAYVLSISRYSDFLSAVLTNSGVFCAVQNYAEKAELSKYSCYPKSKFGVTMHFSEIIKLLCIVELFTNFADNYLRKMRGYRTKIPLNW